MKNKHASSPTAMHHVAVMSCDKSCDHVTPLCDNAGLDPSF